MGENYCTNCGADLDIQPGFDSNNGYWTCTVCGKLMINPDDPDFSSDVVWFCDECGACLNKQYGFSEGYSSWTCTACGHINPINPDEVYASEAEYQEDKARKEQEVHFSCDAEVDEEDEPSQEYVVYDEDDEEENSYEYLTHQDYESTGFVDSLKVFFNIVFKWIKRIIYCVLILCVLCTVWMIYSHFSTKESNKIDNCITIGISSSDILGKDHTSIEKRLKELGFADVDSYEMCDLIYSERSRDGIIERISVAGEEIFDSSMKYDKDVHIIIEYHSLKIVNPPMTSNEAKKQNYNDVVKAFNDAGFGNIKLVQEKDLITGWLTKDGSVESVAINGDTKYQTSASFLVDIEITITYHTFKEK